jgi:hypothetical protein
MAATLTANGITFGDASTQNTTSQGLGTPALNQLAIQSYTWTGIPATAGKINIRMAATNVSSGPNGSGLRILGSGIAVSWTGLVTSINTGSNLSVNTYNQQNGSLIYQQLNYSNFNGCDLQISKVTSGTVGGSPKFFYTVNGWIATGSTVNTIANVAGHITSAFAISSAEIFIGSVNNFSTFTGNVTWQD